MAANPTRHRSRGRRSAPSAIHPLNALVTTAGVAGFAVVLFLTLQGLGDSERVDRPAPVAEAPTIVPGEPWQQTFHARLDAVTKSLEGGPAKLAHPEVRDQGGGRVSWTYRRYQVELPRADADKLRAALELARAGTEGVTVTVNEDDSGFQGDVGIDGLLTHSVVARWQNARSGPPRVALIVDDLGNDMLVVGSLVTLEVPVALAVMPFRPFSREVAEKAAVFNREVLLHLPLEAQSGEDFGGEVLSADASREEVAAFLERSLASVPHAIGVNNHMGSRFTKDPERMGWLLADLHGHDLFFVDSLTTSESAAPRAAAAAETPILRRDIFLDDPPDPEVIRKRLAELIEAAKAHGSAIGIGHPHPATLDALKSFGETARANGVEVVTLSALLNPTPEPAPAQQAKASE